MYPARPLPHEPLHSSFIMGRMALAARRAERTEYDANTKEDIAEIQTQVDLPVIGIVKRDYEDSKGIHHAYHEGNQRADGSQT